MTGAASAVALPLAGADEGPALLAGDSGEMGKPLPRILATPTSAASRGGAFLERDPIARLLWASRWRLDVLEPPFCQADSVSAFVQHTSQLSSEVTFVVVTLSAAVPPRTQRWAFPEVGLCAARDRLGDFGARRRGADDWLPSVAVWSLRGDSTRQKKYV
jgi:hypothetical protein